MPEIHEQRQAAESFGTDAQRYDRARPRYPAELISRVSAYGKDVLDVGIGTGIAARQLRDAGCRVTGVDADPRMAAVARGHGFEVDVSRFEDWPTRGRTFEVVTAGMTWHWIDPARGAAKAASALRPGGRLVLFWYVFEPEPAIRAALGGWWSGARPAVDAYSAILDRADAGMRPWFGPAERWRFDRDVTYTRDEWLDFMPTQGTWTRLPEDERARLLEETGAVIDAAGGSFRGSYATIAIASALLKVPDLRG